jgi:hypothetical protein
MEAAIAEKFQIDFHREEISVTKIDREMLIAERRTLFSADGVKWTGEDSVRTIRPPLLGCAPELAEDWFMRTALAIGLKS